MSSVPPSSKKQTPKASVVKFKAALRKAKRKNARDPEIDFLNIVALLDLMTIILVFLLQSMASSAAAFQESDDLRLARSVMSGDPSDQGVILVISKSAILLGEEGEPVVRLPSREQLAQQGLDASHKRSGPSDLYIVPLANLEAQRGLVEQNLRRLVDRCERDGLVMAEDDDFPAFHALHVRTLDRKDARPYLPPEAFRPGAVPPDQPRPPRSRLHLGDIIVSVERAVDQAAAGRGGHTGDVRWTAAEELRLLVTHGTLHICGFDHAEPAEEAAMRGLERRLLDMPNA